MKEPVIIVKVGGAVVEDDRQLDDLLTRFAAIKAKKVLVHGGGRRATKVAAALGIESRMVGGRRITDAPMLEVVTMVYGGLVNKNLVARLQAHGVNALGLTGADVNVIRSHRRPPREGVDFGFVGDIDQADGQMLHTLIQAGITPVMAPLTHDAQGHILNTNADTIASATAVALAPFHDVTLVYAFEQPGVMTGTGPDAQVIPTITHESFTQLVADGTISGGMIPKIENALQAVSQGVGRVVITRADAIDGTKGTMVI